MKEEFEKLLFINEIFLILDDILTPSPNEKNEKQFSNRLFKIVKLVMFKCKLTFSIKKLKNLLPKNWV